MNDEVERSIGVRQAMNIDFGVGGEDMAVEQAQDGA